MKRRHLRLARGFRVAITNRHAQAAEMVIAPGESEGDGDNRHRGADQWLYVISGSGTAMVNGRRIPLRAGTLLLIERRDRHEVKNTGRGWLRIQPNDGVVVSGSTSSTDNVAPTADFNAESPVDEGSPFAVSMANVFDPSSGDTTAGFEYRFDCGDGFGAWQSAPSTSCTTDDDNDHSVAGEVRDKDGKVRAEWRKVSVPGHAEEGKQALRSL